MSERIAELTGISPAMLLTLGVVSLFVFLGTLIAIPFILVRLPTDYFDIRVPRTWMKDSQPVLRVAGQAIKNIAGLLFFLAGLSMLILPGQGILTILIGISLLDFPGKRRLEARIVGQRTVFGAVNSLRARFGKPPLVMDPEHQPQAPKPEPRMDTVAHERASTSTRLGEFLIDVFLIWIAVYVISRWQGADGRVTSQLSSSLIFPLYILVRDIGGLSPGKTLMRLQVTDMAGRDANTLRRILRNAGLAAGLAWGPGGSFVGGSLLDPFFSLLYFAELFTTFGDRRLGDRLAGTKVVLRERHPASTASRSVLAWTVRAVILVGLVAVAGPIAVREKAAQDQFEREAQVLQEVVAETVNAIRPKIKEAFLKDASGNPGLASMISNSPELLSDPFAFTYTEKEYPFRKRSGRYVRAENYEPRIVISTPSASADFSKGSITRDFVQVDVTVRCFRPFSLIPQPPRIELLDHGAPQNALFLEALRKALDEKGMQYSVAIAKRGEDE